MTTNKTECLMCGLCKYNCPVFKVTLKETLSPRGKAVLIKKGVYDKNVFYMCSLCKACEETCPVKVDIGIRKARENLVSQRKETEANKKMMINIKKYGNPFGKPGEKPKDLYCC